MAHARRCPPARPPGGRGQPGRRRTPRGRRRPAPHLAHARAPGRLAVASWWPGLISAVVDSVGLSPVMGGRVGETRAGSFFLGLRRMWSPPSWGPYRHPWCPGGSVVRRPSPTRKPMATEETLSACLSRPGAPGHGYRGPWWWTRPRAIPGPPWGIVAASPVVGLGRVGKESIRPGGSRHVARLPSVCDTRRKSGRKHPGGCHVDAVTGWGLSPVRREGRNGPLNISTR